MKRLILTAFTVCLLAICLLALPTKADAATVASGTCGDNLSWVLDDTGTLTISGTGAMPNWTSSSNAPWYAKRSSIKRVVIADGVTSIGSYAFFYHYIGLSSVTIPDSVTSIGRSAFDNCTALTSITIPDSVTDIGDSVFSNCTELTSVTIGNGATSIGDSVFSGCTKLTSVTIGNGVTSIGKLAFSCCHGLTSITIPDSVIVIGDSAFYYCTSLESIIIGNGVTDIGIDAFSCCSSLTSVTMGSNVTSIGKFAFTDCTSLISVAMGDSVADIGDYAFNECSKLQSVTMGKGVVSIGGHAFYNCTRLTSVTIPDRVTDIGEHAFYGCSRLASVTIGGGVINIGSYAFYNCTDLTEIYFNAIKMTDLHADNHVFGFTGQNGTGIHVTIGEKVTKIPAYLFYPYTSSGYSAPKLTSVEIKAESVCESIGVYAFYYCTSLKSVTMGNGVAEIGDYAFSDCFNLTSVTYCGTEEQWNNTYIGDSNSYLTSATRYYHNWAGGSCTSPRACSICGIVEDRVVGHRGDNWFEVIKPTCEGTGLKARICEVCGQTETVTVPALGHTYKSVTTEPTCTQPGYTIYTCSTCGAEETQTISATGHNYTAAVSKPTCTQHGFTTYTCPCGDSYIADYVDATGHSWSAWLQVNAATCTQEGLEQHTCAACGTEEIRTIPAKGHSWSAWIQVTAPTCTAEGSQLHFCNCGVSETTPVAKLPHNYVDGACSTCSAVMSGYVVLGADMELTGLKLTEDLYIDLNGFDLTGTVTTNGYKIYGMDSTTDNYTCEAIGHMNLVDENGNVIVPVSHFKSDITGTTKRYMAIKDENGYSFHRFYLGVTHMSVKPTTTGVGYKGVFYGDRMVAANLGSFGFTLQLQGNDPVTVTLAADKFVSGKTFTLRIDNFDVEKYGETALMACATLQLADGTVIQSAAASMTMRSLMEQLNTVADTLSEAQLTAIKAMIEKYAIIKAWKVENLI